MQTIFKLLVEKEILKNEDEVSSTKSGSIIYWSKSRAAFAFVFTTLSPGNLANNVAKCVENYAGTGNANQGLMRACIFFPPQKNVQLQMQAILYSRVFNQQREALKPAAAENWHDELNQPDWSKNVLKHVPVRTRRLPGKQRGGGGFDSIAEEAEE